MNKPLRLLTFNSEQDLIPLTFEEKKKFENKLISSWELSQKAKGYTKATIDLNIRNMLEFIELTGKFVWDIEYEDVELFYEFLVGKNLAHSTRRKYQSNISTFYDYLRARKQIEIYTKIGKPVPHVIDNFNRFFHRRDDNDTRVVPPKKEVLDLLFTSLIEDMKNGRKYYTVARDYVFFKTLLFMGLRINELVMIDVKDVRFDLGEFGKLHVRHGKGSRGTGPKPRWVPLINGSKELLEWYLKEIYPHFEDKYGDGALFLSETKVRASRDNMRNTLQRREREAGIPVPERFSAHQLRHAFATNMTESGVDILTSSKLLGHSDISVTAGYIDSSSDFIEKRIRLSQKKMKKELLGMESES